jgi:hypothetical protein
MDEIACTRLDGSERAATDERSGAAMLRRQNSANGSALDESYKLLRGTRDHHSRSGGEEAGTAGWPGMAATADAYKIWS